VNCETVGFLTCKIAPSILPPSQTPGNTRLQNLVGEMKARAYEGNGDGNLMPQFSFLFVFFSLVSCSLRYFAGTLFFLNCVVFSLCSPCDASAMADLERQHQKLQQELYVTQHLHPHSYPYASKLLTFITVAVTTQSSHHTPHTTHLRTYITVGSSEWAHQRRYGYC